MVSFMIWYPIFVPQFLPESPFVPSLLPLFAIVTLKSLNQASHIIHPRSEALKPRWHKRICWLKIVGAEEKLFACP